MPSPLVESILKTDALEESSKTQYLEKLATLTKLLGKPVEYLVDHPRHVIAAIAKHYPQPLTQRTFVTAIKALFHYNDLKASKASQYQEYTEHQNRLSQAATERYMAAEPSDRERRNWVPWDEVRKRERELAATEHASDEHLLLAMYCLIEPLRQDYGALHIMVNKEPDEGAPGNYLCIADTGAWGSLILNKYKTAKKYGTFKRQLPPDLLGIIKASLLARPRRYLFLDESGQPYHKTNSFTKMSNRTLARIFGKNFTVSMMRHSYISSIDYNASTPGELFEKSRNMAHSIAMQQLYRRKVEPLPPLTVTKLPDTATPQPPQPQPQPQGVSFGSDGSRYLTLVV